MEKTWKPTTAGILSIISGVIGVIFGIFLATVGALLGGLEWLTVIPGMGGLVAGMAAIPIILGIVAIVGGIYALKRRLWGLALAGAICALGPTPLNIILGILAIIFVAIGKREFE